MHIEQMKMKASQAGSYQHGNSVIDHVLLEEMFTHISKCICPRRQRQKRRNMMRVAYGIPTAVIVDFRIL